MWRDFDERSGRWEPEQGSFEYVVQFRKKKYVGPIPKAGDIRPMLIVENYEVEDRYLAKNGGSAYYETTDIQLAACFDSYISAEITIKEYKNEYANYAGHNMKIIRRDWDDV